MKKAASRFGLPRWGRWVLGILAVLLMFYAALGFVLVPRALRAKLPGKLGQLLDRPVSVGDIRLNPFTLDFTVDDFAVRERDGAGFAGWGRLHLRLGWSTLVSRTVNLRELELVRPYGNVVLEKGGRLNFSDLVARLGTGQAAAPAPAAPARILRIGRLAIQDARIHLQDRALDEPFATTLGPLTLDLEGFSTEPARDTPYQFSGRTEAGESFQWKGDFSLAPLASRGNLRIDRLRLPKYQPFLHDSVAFRLAAGLASARAGYRFQWSQGVHLLKLEHGELDLEDLQVAPERGPAALELPRAELRGLEADLMGRSAQVASLRLRDGRVQLTRGADGALDLVKLLTPLPRPKPKPAEPSGPFQLQVRELSLEGFRVA